MHRALATQPEAVAPSLGQSCQLAIDGLGLVDPTGHRRDHQRRSQLLSKEREGHIDVVRRQLGQGLVNEPHALEERRRVQKPDVTRGGELEVVGLAFANSVALHAILASSLPRRDKIGTSARLKKIQIHLKVAELTSKRVPARELTPPGSDSRLPPNPMPPRSHTAAVRTGRKHETATAADPFRVLLKQVRREVDARLSTLFQRKLTEAEPFGNDVVALVDALRDLTMRGGKRFRPALLVAAYHAVDDKAPDALAFDAGAALELLQTYLLVHDDLMDRDDIRRGGPAVHAMLAHHYGSRMMGDAAALLAGDYAAAVALEALCSVKATPDRLARATLFFAQIQQDAIRGQHMDLAGRAENVEVMHDLKTGSYTVRGPMLLGAILAGASPETTT